jgi:hypothetical protein
MVQIVNEKTFGHYSEFVEEMPLSLPQFVDGASGPR